MFVVNRTQRRTRRAQVGGAPQTRSKGPVGFNPLPMATRKVKVTPPPAPDCPRGKLQSGPTALCDGWYVVPEPRKAAWATAFPDMSTCWQDRNELTKEPANYGALVKDYIACIMRIDELRQAALLFAYKEFGIDPSALTGPERVSVILDNAQAIQADTTLQEYLKDVEYLISFPQAKEKDLLASTKEKLLREDPLRNMIYPWRLSNLQIRLLAENFKYLKVTDRDLNRLQKLKQNNSPSYKAALEITAGHLMSEAYELSYKLTGEEPNDGLFMYQHVGNYKATFATFYKTMLDAIVDNMTQFNSERCKVLFFMQEDVLITTAARAAASIFLLYKNTPTWTYDDLLTQFKEEGQSDCRLRIDKLPEGKQEKLRRHLPTTAVWTTPIRDGVSLDVLLGQLDQDLMQFVLQLAYRLQFPDAGVPTKKQETAA
jgi:hypothetical protein